MTSRRSFLTTLAAAGVLPWVRMAHAEPGFPSKVVKIVVPYTPGGAPDLIARVLASELGKQWAQSIVVENKPGAGGSIGTDYVARADGDGYTLLSGGVGTHAINPVLYKNIRYDPVKDFTHLTLVGNVANMLIANESFPANNLDELVDLVRKNPNKFAYGSPGNGTSPHLAGELFCQMTGLKLAHIPYKGSAGALNDLMGGQIPLAFDNLTASLPFVKEGKVKVFAVTTSERSPLLPDVPTFSESGVPGYELSAWAGIFAPKGLPPALAAKISADIGNILQKPAVKEKLLTLGVQASPNTPEAFTAFVSNEGAKFRKLADQANLQLG
ncbi:Bug family tripartite tricarboxylate transporter substrate binding protein [Bordetella avium]|uniref:Bug family tripartite tricarboxylate transporter substrate binding protein n=1 Tax=Bordetella avium TaxID=521 RepID=UPI000E0AC561|nr:tripartite tricarboxylate transporter substrate binding protein [Bordetella avium]AZY51846.1 LacI family transcriptional regulator [Bordetella avium]RIQ13774.1 tripartite tricarboxylate transporter substrate binding protein [Bordetella avium]RIQ17154.1 tripartite tricarboxylate transporter substrate binding protein [Bordetella avium]RIQ36120.1 tripartite tricarboxylate transporter substrate binding protein [Bordetella avium]RIQ39471.1 tripartite tricarboxylate transporter substrate binding 